MAPWKKIQAAGLAMSIQRPTVRYTSREDSRTSHKNRARQFEKKLKEKPL
jgi:hypothetical protein